MEDWVLIAGVALVCILLALLVVLWRSGAFQAVEVTAGSPPVGEAVLAYKFARGHYKNSGVEFAEAATLAPNSKCMGIYYDDPKLVPVEKLRYAVGSLLSEGDANVDKDLKAKMLAAGFKIAQLPSVARAVKTTFPFTGSLSIMLAVRKVYPKMEAYIVEKKLEAYPFLEVYQDGSMHTWAPLSKQDQFFVEEANDPEMESYYK